MSNNFRYQRHALIDWFPQQEVHNAKIAIIGCGAVGNEVAKNLALLGVKHLDLFDFDSIEIHNLTKSVLFREQDIGLNKVDVAKKRLVELEPTIKVNAYYGDFWDRLTFDMLKEYSCVLCCVDNFEARIKLNQLCLLSGIPLINTGIDSKYSQIEIYPFTKDNDTSCYECSLPLTAYEKIQQRYSCGWLKKVAFEEKKIPTTILTSSITGAFAASLAMRVIKGDSFDHASRILLDSFTGQSSLVILSKSEQCPCCSKIEKPTQILSCHREISSLGAFSEHNLLLTSSDPILISATCSLCDEENQAISFTRAMDSDAHIMRCETCQSNSVLVEIKDYFTLKELQENYADKQFPGKFVQFQFHGKTIIIELRNNECQI